MGCCERGKRKNQGWFKKETGCKVHNQKETTGLLSKLVEQLQSQIIKFKTHTFNIKNQYKYYRKQKESMKLNECLI